MSNRWRILLVIGLTLTIADQWTKYLAVKHLTPGIAIAKSGATTELNAEQVADINEDTSLLEGLGYFYTEVRHPCRSVRIRCPTVPVIDGFWNFRYVENPGAAWGLMSTASESIRVPFFLFVSFAAVVFILLFFRKLTDDQHLMIWSLSLVFGGAIGNLIDRLHLNYVVDFIDWYVGRSHWPTFNIADAGITAGVILLLLEWLRDAVRNRSSESTESA